MTRPKAKVASARPAGKKARTEDLPPLTPAAVAIRRRFEARAAELIGAEKKLYPSTRNLVDVLRAVLEVLEESPGVVPGDAAGRDGMLVAQHTAAALAEFERPPSPLVYAPADRTLAGEAEAFVRDCMLAIRVEARTREERLAVKDFQPAKNAFRSPPGIARALRRLEAAEEKHPSVWANARLTREDLAQARSYAERLEGLGPQVTGKQVAVVGHAMQRKRVAWVAQLWCEAVVSAARHRLGREEPVRAAVLAAARINPRGGRKAKAGKEEGTPPLEKRPRKAKKPRRSKRRS